MYAIAVKCADWEKRMGINQMPGVWKILLENASNSVSGNEARRKGIMHIMCTDERSPERMKKPINRYGLKAYLTKGERMLKQKAIVEGQGWCSCYICLPCVENWLEESGQVEEHG